MTAKAPALTAREILRAEYGTSRNFMTPDRISIGKLGRDTAYELSAGSGLVAGTHIYGVSIVRVQPDGTTERDHDASTCFPTIGEARDYIERLRP